ncbi:MAG: hypothetical protein ACI3XQ_11435 [Eubacteriales bacterium]
MGGKKNEGEEMKRLQMLIEIMDMIRRSSYTEIVRIHTILKAWQ